MSKTNNSPLERGGCEADGVCNNVFAESLSGDSADTLTTVLSVSHEVDSAKTSFNFKDVILTSQTTKLNIGLFGFGCVGQGLYDVLNHSQSLRAEIGNICIKDRSKKRRIENKYFTFDRSEILNCDEHDLVVELIDDADAALAIVVETLAKGKDVVTANKKMVAENFEYLYELQVSTGASLLYEAACAGSIPIIRTLEEYYDNELLRSVKGILNGSSNYILTKMEAEGLSFENALLQAQHSGFAESDPYLDIAGFDSKYKLCLLTAHAFGLILKPEDVLNFGIQNISPFDINYSKEKNSRIKLVAHAEKNGSKHRIFVLPYFVLKDSALGTVNYEYNGIEVEGVYSDKQFFAGKGAGGHSSGSAVLSDISAITYDYKYGYRKLKKRSNGHVPDYSKDHEFVDEDFPIRLYIRYNDKCDLKDLQIESVEEEYSSANAKYIIAHVNFASLTSVKSDSKLFICAAE